MPSPILPCVPDLVAQIAFETPEASLRERALDAMPLPGEAVESSNAPAPADRPDIMERLSSLEAALAKVTAELAEQKDINAKFSEALGNPKSTSSGSACVNMQAAIEIAEAIEVADRDMEEGQQTHNTMGSAVTDRVVQDMVAHEEEHVIHESAWDVCVFVGMSWMNTQEMVIVVSTLVLNTTMQLVFCLIVAGNMNSPPIDADTVLASEHWRGVYGHNYAFADHETGISLVSLVCASDEGMLQSSAQMIMYDDIQDYLTPEGNDFLTFEGLNGIVMCIIASFCWCLLVACDIRGNYMFTRAVWFQPDGKAEMQILNNGESFSILALHKVQKVLLIVLISIPRLSIALLLCYVGLPFLAYTYRIEDLIMNAMALGFVLDIDELFYSSFGPYRVKRILERCTPLQMPPRKSGNLDKILTSAIVAVVVLWSYYTNLAPFVKDLRSVSAWLCEGDTQFVTTTNPGSRDVYSFQSAAFRDAKWEDTYVKQQTLDLSFCYAPSDHLGQREDCSPREFAWEYSVTPPSIDTIEVLSKGDVHFGSNQLRCVDHLDMDAVQFTYGHKGHYYGMKKAIIGRTGNTSITSCADLVADPNSTYCTEYQNDYIRAICPLTCGCTDPWYGNMFSTTNHGCPGSCKAAYIATLQGIGTKSVPSEFVSPAEKCKDVGKNKLIAQDAWRIYMSGLASMFYTLQNRTQGVGAYDLGMKHGCEVVPSLYVAGVDLCSPGQGGIGRSVRPFCPETCKQTISTICTTSDLDECPQGCYSISTPYVNATTGKVTYTNTLTGATTTLTAGMNNTSNNNPLSGEAAPACKSAATCSQVAANTGFTTVPMEFAGNVYMAVTLPDGNTADAFVKETTVIKGVRSGVAAKVGCAASWISLSLAVASGGRRLATISFNIDVEYTITIPSGSTEAKLSSVKAALAASTASDAAGRTAWSSTITTELEKEEPDVSVKVTRVKTPRLTVP